MTRRLVPAVLLVVVLLVPGCKLQDPHVLRHKLTPVATTR